jgi:hypothetical protein
MLANIPKSKEEYQARRASNFYIEVDEVAKLTQAALVLASSFKQAF